MVMLAVGLDWNIFFKPAFDGSGTYLRFLLVGFEWTLLLSILAWILAFVIGSIIGVIRTLPGKFLPTIGAIYVEIFRNIPLLVQLFLWYFVLPEIIPGLGTWFKQGLSPLLQQLITGVLCLGFFTAARVAEQVRSGINALGSGQRGAGLALGLDLSQVYRLILLPVAYRIIVPTLTSEFLNTIKNSAVASTIGLAELSRQSQQLGEFTAHWYEAFIAVTLLYGMINIIVMVAARYLERAARLPGYIGGKN
ncbi:MAG TPA: amino acid ABC transporter permease [Chthoniobacterales bacterium]|nr:amino acid ABC transporter permease [Chthoniobacterales bacterium]